MNEHFNRILLLFILFPVCHVKEHCQLDEVKKDIFFLLDSSGSVGGRNFRIAKSFIAGFINRLSIGLNDTHVAIVRFSSMPKRYASLNSYYSKKNLTAAVLSIRYNGGSTNTAEVLEFSRKKLMKRYRGDRNDVDNIIIIITDGSSTSLPAKLRREVAMLHSMGVVIVAIGVGGMVNKTELDAMASEERFSFSVQNYNALFDIQSSLFGVACQTVKPISDIVGSSTQKTTGQFKVRLDITTESQTVFSTGSSSHGTNLRSTRRLSLSSQATFKFSLQTLPSGITLVSDTKTNHQQTTTLASPKTVQSTRPFIERINGISESQTTILRLFTTESVRKLSSTVKHSSTLPLLTNSKRKIQGKFRNSFTESLFKGSTESFATSTNENKGFRSVTEYGQFDYTTENYVNFSTKLATVSSASETEQEIDGYEPRKELDDITNWRKGGNYFRSKSNDGFSTKVQNDFNIMLYTTIGFAVLVVVSVIIMIATRKYGVKRRKGGLETV